MLAVLKNLNDKIEKQDKAMAPIREMGRIISHASIKLNRVSGNTFEYDFEGEPITTCIWHTPAVAVSIFQAKAGTVFPEHAHPYREDNFILDGEVVITFEGKDWHLIVGGKGDEAQVYTDPGVPHSGIVIADATLMCMTRPADPSYPRPLEV